MKVELTQAQKELTELRKQGFIEKDKWGTLDWLDKSDSEPVFTEAELFEMPIPQEHKFIINNLSK